MIEELLDKYHEDDFDNQDEANKFFGSSFPPYRDPVPVQKFLKIEAEPNLKKIFF